ncbi:MAG: hypothetical protein ACE5HI_10050 [bacterium]
MRVKKLKRLLKNSKATDSFKQALQKFLKGEESELIVYSPGSPAIKIIRVIMKLLEEYPDEAITEVNIQGVSSCSTYRGTLTCGPEHIKIEFNWDCRWKAEQEGLKTWFGQPDQTKAARIFGHQCFEKFEKMN